MFQDDILIFDLNTFQQVDKIDLAQPPYPGASPYRLAANEDAFDAPDTVTSVFTAVDSVVHKGTLGMARSSEPDSANSQFFICLADASFLNGKYTVFGEVTSGMDVVDKIKKGDQAADGAVANPDKIVKMRLASSK